jgi:hypothetical protein
MATYTFDAANDASTLEWLFTNGDGTTGNSGAATNRKWGFDVNETRSTGVGPLTGQSSAGYVYVEASSPGAFGDVYTMESPVIDLSTSFIDFSVYYSHRFSGSFGSLYIEGWNGTAWGVVLSYPGLTGSDATWKLANTDFAAYSNSTFKIRIRFTVDSGTAWHMDLGIDSISWNLTPRNAHVGPTSDTDATTNQISDADPNGTTVGITAFAVDPDVETITYSLTDNAGGRFTINSTTGVVTVANASLISWAVNTNHNITVRSTSADLTFTELIINIAVINDTPIPISPLSDINASENIINEICVNGDTVGIVAFAEDINFADTVTYSLDDNAGGRFAIGTSTGIVTVADAANIIHANATSHLIIVRATSTDTSTVTSNFSITVQKEILAQLASTTKFNSIKTTGQVRVKLGALPNGLSVLGHLILEEVIDFDDVTIVNGKMEFEKAGTYNATNCNIAEITNTSGGSITLNSNGSNFLINTGPNINVVTSSQLTFTGLVVGTEVRLYQGTNPQTATDVAGIENVTDSTYTIIHGAGGVNGYARIFSIGYDDIFLNLTPIPAEDTSIPIQQRVDRWYKNN